MVGLRLREPAAALLVSGFAVDDGRIGPTPPHWRDAPAGAIGREEAYLLLIGSLLGDPFGRHTQQGGRLVHNVVPTKGQEQQQVSSNSSATLSWHTEDGFCEYRPDYVGLLCLRNPDHAVTRYLDVSRLPVPAQDRRLLGEPVYRIRSDYSHDPAQNPASAASAEVFDRIGAYDERIAVLSVDPQDPVVRLDADFTDAPAGPEHAAALARLCRQVEASLADVVLEPGDLLLIDNFRGARPRALRRPLRRDGPLAQAPLRRPGPAPLPHGPARRDRAAAVRLTTGRIRRRLTLRAASAPGPGCPRSPPAAASA